MYEFHLTIKKQIHKHMKTILIPLFVLALIVGVSCKGDAEKKTNDTQVETSTETVENTSNDKNSSSPVSESTGNSGISTKSKADLTPVDLEYIVKDFISCKAKATERNDCRSRITKVISETYNLSEFKDPELGHVIYDSIRPIIERSGDWERIGTAMDQEILDRALAHTNSGGLSLVIDTSTAYGHVVMMLPGETKKSGSWALKLPTVLSLVNYKPEKSFHDKSLSYALSKSEELMVYIRK